MFRYTVDAEAKLVVVTFEGTLTDDEVAGYLEAMLAATDYGSGWRTLIDATRVVHVAMTGEGMRLLAKVSKDRLRGASAAIVAPPKSAVFGMSRMYEMLTDDDIRIRVFTELSKAREWLGIA